MSGKPLPPGFGEEAQAAWDEFQESLDEYIDEYTAWLDDYLKRHATPVDTSVTSREKQQ